MANAFGPEKYQVYPISSRRCVYRWQVIDTERSGKIVARTAGKEAAEHIARELNEKGFVETA